MRTRRSLLATLVVATLVVASLGAASAAAAASFVVAKAGVSVGTGSCTDIDDSGVLSAPSANAAATCPSGSAEARVDLTNASLGIFASADSTPQATTISNAESELFDRLHFHVPPELDGQPFSLGILFAVDGAMGAGATPNTGLLLSARCTITDIDSAQGFDGLAIETTPFSGTRTFPGVLSVTPPDYTINVSMHMLAPGVTEDVVDFLTSGTLYLGVPSGVTYDSDSGVFFAPEPGAPAIAGAAAAALAAVSARAHRGLRARRSANRAGSRGTRAGSIGPPRIRAAVKGLAG
jgi:hypothetical protein